jgi:hypothetical protein
LAHFLQIFKGLESKPFLKIPTKIQPTTKTTQKKTSLQLKIEKEKNPPFERQFNFHLRKKHHQQRARKKKSKIIPT